MVLRKLLKKCVLEVKRFNPKTYAYRLLALGVGALLSIGANKEPSQSLPKDSGSFFISSNPDSPNIGETLKSYIKDSKNDLNIQIYALSDKSLISLLNKKAQTTNVSIYYDPSASKDLSEKLDKSIKLAPYTHHGLMHRKITVIDDKISLIGSANYTSSSLFWHYNNLCMVPSCKLAQFLKNKTRGSCSFEYGKAYLLPDYKNYALMHVISKIKNARSSIHLAMFSLTHNDILKSLEDATTRGVKLFLYIDKANLKQANTPLLPLMKKCEKVFIQKTQVLMHHKLCFIDGNVMITGSSNWSKSGFKKNEEVLVIFDKLDSSNLEQCKNIFLNLQDELECVTFEKPAA
jgi:phosphatidylserine/phosphatidylglycerophosphate/cardiolipin synthase-like enzyme